MRRAAEDAVRGEPEDWSQVVQAVRDGDRVALVKLTRLISGFLMRYRAYEVREQWDDLIQDVLVALLRGFDSQALREPRALVNYVGAITRNKLFDFRDRQRRPGSPDLEGDPAGASDRSAGAREEGTGKGPDAYLDLGRALERLPEKLRAVVDAIYLQGFSYEEAASRLGMPLGTLKRIQNQGLRELRALMGRDP
jgi:RNA polymerase sigma-70 factor (ECF subfamily)